MPGESPQKSAAPNGSEQHPISRRRLLTAGMGGAGLVGAAAVGASLDASRRAFAEENHAHGHARHLMPTVVGEVDHAKNGFHPTEILTDFDSGQASKLANGQTLREFTVIAQNTVVEVVPGLKFAAWTYNGRIP